MKLVRESDLGAPDGGFISSHMGRITTLGHKAFNIAVEDGAIVLAAGGQGEEIKGSPRAGIAKDLTFDVADRSVDSDRHEECRKLLRRERGPFIQVFWWQVTVALTDSDILYLSSE